MNKLAKSVFTGRFPSIDGALLSALDVAFGGFFDRSQYIPFVVREFVDATTAAQSRYLPSIANNSDKDYCFVKIDVSANAVTIYPAGTDTIEGATSYALAAQYDNVTLAPNNGVWYII